MYLMIMLLAAGLSMDAFAVSISGGMVCRKVPISDVLKISFVFGGFQALMPVLGYFSASLFSSYIDSFDHYIAFAILLFIGIKMLYEGIRKGACEVNPFFFRNSNILLLGLATSIDAFLAGLSLYISAAPLLTASIIIGSTTFVFCFAGVKLGCRLGCRFERGADILGGAILVFLGFKTLLEGLGVF